MKIVKLKAGLGNQMFQYAFYILLKEKYGITDLLIDTSYYYDPYYKRFLESGINLLSVNYATADKETLRKFGLPYNNYRPHHFLHRTIVAINSIFNKKYFFEKNRAFIDVDSIMKYSYFDGYWQSWRYLEPIRQILLKDFQPRNDLSSLTMFFIKKFSLLDSVFIGIRKGDYNSSAKTTNHYGVPSLDYYKRAIDEIKKRIKDPYFVVFSDDIEWVKRNFDFLAMGVHSNEIEYRDKDVIMNNFEELFIMSSCKHAIISNSTFNYWGAWLIQNENKIVIAPKKWFKDGKPIDIIPPSWIQI